MQAEVSPSDWNGVHPHVHGVFFLPPEMQADGATVQTVWSDLIGRDAGNSLLEPAISIDAVIRYGTKPQRLTQDFPDSKDFAALYDALHGTQKVRFIGAYSA